jgi:simple sugar transport system permease protein
MAELKKRHEFWLALLIMVLFVGLAWRSDEFLTFGNLYDLANNYAMLTILACGLFVVLISGGIDFVSGNDHHCAIRHGAVATKNWW